MYCDPLVSNVSYTFFKKEKAHLSTSKTILTYHYFVELCLFFPEKLGLGCNFTVLESKPGAV